MLKRATTENFKWSLFVWALALLVATPALSVVYLSFSREGFAAWGHLADTVLLSYIANTLELLIGVGVLSLIFGVTSAWLVTRYKFPFQEQFEWLMLLPFAMPPYVIAYVYTDLLEYAGWVQTTIRDIFGFTSAQDYWFFDIRSMGGAISMMALVFYPYVFMLARASFLEQSPSLDQAGRILGKNSWQLFWRVNIPLARPGIFAGLALVLMETMNDFGTVSYFAVYTLSNGLYDMWLNQGNLAAAAQIALVMMIFIVLFIVLEKFARRKQKHYSVSELGFSRQKTQLKGIKKWLAFSFLFAILFAGFLLPFAILLRHSIVYFSVSFSQDFLKHTYNSLLLSGLTAFFAVVFSVLLAYGKRLAERKNVQIAVYLASLGYALPGVVLGIGILIPFSNLDTLLNFLSDKIFGIETGAIFAASFMGLVFALITRFLAVALGSVDASLGKITPSLDMAGRSLGARPFKLLRKIHLPLMRVGLLTGILIVFVDVMKELPATLILRPFGFDTLATHVYQYASDELLEESALPALLVVAVGVLPIILLSRSIIKSRKPQAAS